MKKILSVILAVCFMLATVQCAFAADVNDIVIDSTWSILVPESYTQNESYAIDVLKAKICDAIGVYLPVVKSAENKFIAIDIDYSGIADIADNGYAIKADGNKVYINGTGVRGTLYGVYRFLEEFCGHKIYTSTLTVINKSKTIKVPADTNIIYAPYFEYTETDWKSPRDAEYSTANGLTGGSYRSLPAYMGGTVNYLGGLCHTFTSTFCNADKYFADHPEYFAYRDGKRIKDQLCLTNPDVLNIVKQEVLDLLRREHDPSASLQIVSLTQADNRNYCECDNCKKFEKKHGKVQSATMINFVNQVADAVKDAGYNNVALDTFAYQYTRKAPKNIVPRDNMIVRLCTIEGCFAHTLDNRKCKQNKDIMKDLEDWSKICKRIYIWDYTTNYTHTCDIFPDFDVIQKNIQIFYEHNVKGVYEEGNYYMGDCDTEFGELRAYMISKCLQNPYCDLEKEVDGFLTAYYGAGGKYIGKALKIMSEKAGNKHLTINQETRDTMRLRPVEVSQIEKCWRAAKELAQTDTELENINRSELSWRFWKAGEKRGEFCLMNPKRFDEKRKLFDDIIASGTTRLGENQPKLDYADCGIPEYVSPDRWQFYEVDEFGTRELGNLGKILEFITPLLTAFGGFYKLFTDMMSADSRVVKF